AGSVALRDFVADTDEIAVERLRAAGAIILGKTAVPELGFGPGTQSPLVGVSRNPWDPTRTPGGSSGGLGGGGARGDGPRRPRHRRWRLDPSTGKLLWDRGVEAVLRARGDVSGRPG